MSMIEHLNMLRKKHDDLSEQVEQEQRNPSVNHLSITELKKQKLLLKEKIERLSGG